MIYIFQREDLHGLDLAHVTVREPYDFHHLTHVLRVGVVLYKDLVHQHFTAADTGPTTVDDLDCNVSEVGNILPY